MKKYKFGNAVVALCLLISGCAMPYEEYEARVKYCESKGLRSEAAGEGWTKGSTRRVLCVNKDGIRFPSKMDGVITNESRN